MSAAPQHFPTLEDAQRWLAENNGGEAFDYFRDDPDTLRVAGELGVLEPVQAAIEQSREMDGVIDASVKRAERKLRDRAAAAPPKNAEPEPVTEPRDLWKEPARGPVLDTSAALPPSLAGIVDAVARARGHDPGAIALAIVCALSACLRRRSRISAYPDSASWREGSALWGANIGESGSGKSPSMQFAVAPLFEIQREAVAAVAGSELKPARLVAADTTVEALGALFAECGDRRMLAFRDEGTSFLNGMGQYNGRADAERGNWCSAWNCAPHSIDRLTRGSLHFDDWGVALVMGLTPSQMKEAAAEARQDGLLARMLQCVVRPATGREAPSPASDGAARSYEALARAVYGLGAIIATPGHEAAQLLAQARAHFAEAADTFAASNRQMSVWLRKAASNTLRVALVFAATKAARERHTTADFSLTLDGSDAERAVRFVNWSACHALAFSEINTPSAVIDLAQRVALYVLAKREPTIARRDLSRYVSAWDGAPDERTRGAAVLHLFDAGWITGAAGSRITRGPGLADASAWHINPLALERFSDYGEREIARRRDVRARMLELGGAHG
jgi:hypothetical protein